MFIENSFYSSTELSQWAHSEAPHESMAHDLSLQVENQIKGNDFKFLKDFFLKLSENMKIRFF